MISGGEVIKQSGIYYAWGHIVCHPVLKRTHINVDTESEQFHPVFGKTFSNFVDKRMNIYL